MNHHLFCFDLVGLSPAHLEKLIQMPGFSRLMSNGKKADMTPCFPCLTLPGQASFTTGTPPSKHGIIANGFYYRDKFEISFWDQYRTLVQATPLWETLKQKNPEIKTAVLFCQNTLHGNADVIMTPKPMHTDDGLIQWCYSKPPGFYEKICEDVGRPFNLMDYWGPLASVKASQWIMDAAIEVVKDQQPGFMMTYIPHLDYSCQRFGPDAPQVDADLAALDGLMATFLDTLEQLDLLDHSTICAFSEYSITPVFGAVLINKQLRENQFLSVRQIDGKEYLDFELSRAFAMVDHQIAHIYVKEASDIAAVKELVSSMDGVAKVLSQQEQAGCGIGHERSGELVAISETDKWFAYYWWTDEEKAPDFAGNIDIHRKPGYDPLELFINRETMKIPQTPELIKGSHGAPAKEGSGMAVFMLSGQKAASVSLPETLAMVDAAPILMELMGMHHV